MFECVGLNKTNFNKLLDLNKLRHNFNNLNEDFIKVYNNSNFAQRMLLRRRVKLLIKDSRYIGYIWAEMNDKKNCSIKALNVLSSNNADTLDYSPYKALINNLRKNTLVNYYCESNNFNSQVLENIGFTKGEGTLILSFNVEENKLVMPEHSLQFETLQVGADEGKRCRIQNEIFKNNNRLPLTIDDIYFDEAQSYYVDKGAVFLKKDSQYVGYGQIIIEENTPVIVNFGILKEHRGKGYSKVFLSYLLKVIKDAGFDFVKIKVKNTNNIALNLYKRVGFQVIGEIYNWELKR
ncbi:GNAT family N-acetyltransferase [Clostridium sp. A1-XYC3]|uniref:GNAT family N-acetyltransferase n=1 Tax=Clostridium tanneri TaxID=3037988 RepID=A0ABU4JUX3_9CLOT|nr:GNAT family N-acetyltransferase [Clostridium sp. A1-XYC3]MDW8801940.1 GNAT family N-acetyltransferase [Clostridium sp. A1-XYC3]